MTITSVFPPTFEVGILVLDEEHDDLLAAIDELKYRADELLTSHSFIAWQQRFADLTASHFDHEEAWMIRLGIPQPQRLRHVEEHRRMLLEARALSRATPASDVYKLLKVEFFKHFVQFDAKLKAPAVTGDRPQAAHGGAAC